jgi:hypothetical protein
MITTQSRPVLVANGQVLKMSAQILGWNGLKPVSFALVFGAVVFVPREGVLGNGREAVIVVLVVGHGFRRSPSILGQWLGGASSVLFRVFLLRIKDLLVSRKPCSFVERGLIEERSKNS